ncbi:hypothetical protein TaPaz_158 [Acinetobacter phage TaPaz]|nr:hypothetical protein TaPaz_158 [Acinetobacter phage TaPaz]
MFTYEEILERVKATVNGRDFSNTKTYESLFALQQVPRFKFNISVDGYKTHEYSLSIQASKHHYCTPQKNCSQYTHVEVGFPSFKFSDNFIEEYAEDESESLDTVYGYVPIEELALEIYDFCKKEMKRLSN